MNTTSSKITLARHASWMAAAILLAGCGGGGTEDSSALSPVGDPAGSSPPTDTAASNEAPSIVVSAPASVTAGKTLVITPEASDPDGDTLTFSVEHLPSWASFDTSTGTLTGTPSDADVGYYGNIVISVSDGVATVEGQSFGIDVTQISLGKVTLSWTPPTQNMDGSPLTDLSGYKFYYGTSEGNYTEQITVDNPGISTYVVDNLYPNTYYFVATSYNSAGVESPYSGVAVRVVN